MKNKLLIAVNTPSGSYYVDGTGNVVIPGPYDDCGPFSEGLAAVTVGGRSGYINAEGEVVIPLVYEDCSPFHEGVARVKDGHYMFVCPDGQKAFTATFEDCDDSFHSGVLQVYADKCQLIGIDGRYISDDLYDNCFRPVNGMICVCKDSRYGVIDKCGVELVPCVYPDECEVYADCILVRDENGKVVTLGTDGEPLLDPYDEVIPLGGGRFVIGLDGQYMSVDSSGMMTSLGCLADCQDARDGMLAVLSTDGRAGHYDLEGTTVTRCIYENTYSFFEGLAMVRLGDRFGFVDRNGSQRVFPYLEDAFSFSEGLASGKIAGRWGYIDQSGRPVIPFVYDSCLPFRSGCAVVGTEGRYGLIDRSGRMIVPPVCMRHTDIRFPLD